MKILHVLFVLVAIATLSSCNQGGQIVHQAKKPMAADASGHAPGRYDIPFKTESACTSNQGTWDSAEGECYVMCMSPNVFDQATSRCVQSTAQEPGHAPGRYDIPFKTQSTCTSNQGTWDSAEGECYIMCMSPNVFDKATSKCIQAATPSGEPGHEPGRYDIPFNTESTCRANQGTWDSAESECYVICLAPKIFDKPTSRCK